MYPSGPPFGGPASEPSPRPRDAPSWRRFRRRDTVGIVATPHTPRIGRIPIRGIAPRQPEDRWPAKSFVGEVVPFEATIFREGHGELFAEVLLTDPDGRRDAAPDAAGRLRAPTAGSPRCRSPAPACGRSASARPPTTGRRGCTPPTSRSRRARMSSSSSRWAPQLCCEGSASAIFAQARTALAGSQAHPRGTHEGRARRAPGIRHRRRAADLARDLERVLAAARRARARRRRRLVRVLPALGGRQEGAATAPGSPARSAPPRSACPASPRWASTSSTCRRSTRSGTSSARGRTTRPTAGPADPGSPWAIGSADGGHDAIHPDLGTERRLRVLRAGGRGGRARGRARPRPAVRARPPVGDRASRVVHAAARRLDRLRREPAEEVPGHLPAQLRPRSRGHPRRGAAHRRATGSRAA